MDPTSRLPVIGKLMLPKLKWPKAAIGTMIAAKAISEPTSDCKRKRGSNSASAVSVMDPAPIDHALLVKEACCDDDDGNDDQEDTDQMLDDRIERVNADVGLQVGEAEQADQRAGHAPDAQEQDELPINGVLSAVDSGAYELGRNAISQVRTDRHEWRDSEK
jgi:hypothetical protein